MILDILFHFMYKYYFDFLDPYFRFNIFVSLCILLLFRVMYKFYTLNLVQNLKCAVEKDVDFGVYFSYGFPTQGVISVRTWYE